MKNLLLALIMTAALAWVQQDRSTTGTVEGVVLRPQTNTPVAGVRIRLSHRLGILMTVSDVTGGFSFASVSPGTVEISHSPPTGFRDGAGRGDTTVATLAPGAHLSGIKVYVGGGIVSGRVLMPDGQPAVSATVNAVRKSYQVDGRCVFTTAATTSTDDRGAFRMFDLSEGEYFGRAQNLGPTGAMSGSARSYTFFPGVLDPQRADSILIRGEEEATRIDVELSKTVHLPVSGRLESDFAIDPSFALRLYFRKLDGGCDPGTPVVALVTPTGFEGIASVLPGTYELSASVTREVRDGGILGLFQTAMNLRGSRSNSGSARVEVRGPTLSGVSIRVHELPEVVGRVVVAEASSPLQFETLGVVLTHPNNSGLAAADPAIGMRLRAPVERDGRFTLPTRSDGRHLLSIEGAPRDAYIADIRRDGRSVFDQGVDVDNSSPISIEVVLDSRGKTVSGVAIDTAGNPAPVVRAVLVPAHRRQNPLLYKTIMTDGTGSFTFRGVAPGEYKLFVFENIPQNAWLNRDYLAAFEELGTDIRLETAEEMKGIRVNMIMGNRLQ